MWKTNDNTPALYLTTSQRQITEGSMTNIRYGGLECCFIQNTMNKAGLSVVSLPYKLYCFKYHYYYQDILSSASNFFKDLNQCCLLFQQII